MMDSKPVGMNLLLTDACPFRCPQCYVPFGARPRILPKEKAVYWIAEADRNGIRYVNMSGGETLTCPYLEELIRECAGRGMEASVSISGALATRERLRGLCDAGVGSICVSLNGSTRQINEVTRQGYDEAVRALSYLKEIPGCTRLVNYVMHESNAGDLPALLRLLEQYEVYGLVILGAKPASDGTLPGPPSAGQIAEAAEVLRKYRGPVRWLVNGCFFELRALLPGGGGMDAEGDVPGCMAGRTHVTVTEDGLLAPCNHLPDLAEEYDTLEEYLASSPVLRNLWERCGAQSGWRPCF